MKGPKLSWRREPREHGLAGVVQGERGFDLHLGDECLIRVRPIFSKEPGRSRQSTGRYYFYGGSEKLGIPRINTVEEDTYASADIAKCSAMAYARQHLIGKR